MDPQNDVGEAAAANTAELTAAAQPALGIASPAQLAVAPPLPLLSAPYAPASTDSDLETLGSAISAAFGHPSTSYLLNPLAQPVRTFPYFNPAAQPAAAVPPVASSLPRNQPLSDALQAAQQQTPYVQQYLAAAQQRPPPPTPQVLDPLSVMNALNSYHQSSVQATNSLLSSLMAAAANATAVISAPSTTGAAHHHVATPQPPGVAPAAQLATVAASSNPFALLGQQPGAAVGHSCSCPAQPSTAAFLAPYLQQLPQVAGASTNPVLRAPNSATLMRQQRKRNAAQLRDDSQSGARAKCPRYDETFRPQQAGRSSGQIGLFTPPTTPPRVQLQQMLIHHSRPSQLMSTIPENMLSILPPQVHHQTSQQTAAAAAGLVRPSHLLIPPYAPPNAAATQMNRAIPTALTRTGSLNPSALLGGRHDHAALTSQRQQQRLAQNTYMNNFYQNARVLVPNAAAQQQQAAAAAAVAAVGQAQQQVPLTAPAPLISADFNYLFAPTSNRLIMLRQQANGTADPLPALMLLNPADHPHAAFFLNPADAAAGGPTMAVMHHAPEPQPVGASNDQIKRCTQIRNYVKDPDVPEQEKERCTVCLADFETGEDIRTLHCSHMFHIECIDRWLNYNKKCPVCRVDMDKVPMLITDAEACSMAAT
ncbi:RING-type domain-containing protein [Aphelenchoides fujianensis]|nr:RING-type domain-containing protein [Aphelenchoides fujianensis]